MFFIWRQGFISQTRIRLRYQNYLVIQLGCEATLSPFVRWCRFSDGILRILLQDGVEGAISKGYFPRCSAVKLAVAIYSLAVLK